MPIEIREINIKTNVLSHTASRDAGMDPHEFHRLREQLLDECKKLLLSNTSKRRYKR
jgi:hypothetical protein